MIEYSFLYTHGSYVPSNNSIEYHSYTEHLLINYSFLLKNGS